MEKQKIKYGLIGAGHMGINHLDAVSMIENADIVAFSDIDPDSLDKARKTHPLHGHHRSLIERESKNIPFHKNIRYYTDYRGMIKNEVLINTTAYGGQAKTAAANVATLTHGNLCSDSTKIYQEFLKGNGGRDA